MFAEAGVEGYVHLRVHGDVCEFTTVGWCHVVKPDHARLLPMSFHLSAAIPWYAVNVCVFTCMTHRMC